jgi:hypothetical protein
MNNFYNIQIDRRPAAIVVDIHPQKSRPLSTNVILKLHEGQEG